VAEEEWDPSTPPVYACLTGIELQSDVIDILPGLSLRRVYVDTFGATMMALAPPPTPKSHHPAPWVAVRGGFNFEGRVEVELADMRAYDGVTPSVIIWLVAAILRLHVRTPIRLAVLGNMPFHKMGAHYKTAHAIAFESASHQIGEFNAFRTEVGAEDLEWLRDMLPVAARLYHNERFFRAFSVFDQAQWTPTPELGAMLVWTSIEILFDLASERAKTRAICKALSEYVAADQADRDRAYQVIQELYFQRGRTVHAGRSIAHEDILQLFRIVRVAFKRTLIDGHVPVSPKAAVH
jgi:hypothetical protein